MAGENDQLETLTPEDEANAEAEFLAAFNTTREHMLPHAEGSTTEVNNADADANTPKADEEHEDDAAARAQAEAEAAAVAQAAAEAEARTKAEQEADAPVTLTRAEVDALRAAAAAIPSLQDELRRTRDTTAGKIGSIQQELKAIAARAADGQKSAQVQLKRIKSEFPELGQMLEEDLNEATAARETTPPPGNADDASQAPPVPPAQVDPFADERVQQVIRARERAIVDAVHPDWRELAKTPDFSDWRNQLPQAARDLLASSWDANVLVDAFKDFKAWKSKRDEQAAAQAAADKQRGKRLENAIPATRGAPTGINAVDDDAAFEAGFKAVRTGSR
jgi:hypothetical protein